MKHNCDWTYETSVECPFLSQPRAHQTKFFWHTCNRKLIVHGEGCQDYTVTRGSGNGWFFTCLGPSGNPFRNRRWSVLGYARASHKTAVGSVHRCAIIN